MEHIYSVKYKNDINKLIYQYNNLRKEGYSCGVYGSIFDYYIADKLNIEYYNNNLSPEFIKNDDNYVYYKLDHKDYIKEININTLIKCNNSDLMFKAEQIIDRYNNN